MIANENGQTCIVCKQPIQIGEEISWNRRGETGRYHTACKITAAPIAPAPAGHDAVLGAVLAKTIEPFLTITREEITEELDARLAEKIAEALANLPKETKTVYIQSGRTIGTIDGILHEHFNLLVQLVSMRKSVYLWGEAGSGKSTAAKKIADLFNLPYYYLGLQAQMTESRLMGYMDATGRHIESDFFKAYSTGGIFLLDELELGSGNLLGSLNGALANGSASFPCGRIERHPDFICIATGNTPALGATVTYSDRRALDASVRDRFCFIEWNTDKTLEHHLASQMFDQSAIWVNWIQNVRPMIAKNLPKIPCTQRASIDGSQLIAAGLSPAVVANMLVFRGADKTSIDSILAVYPLPTF